MKLSTAYISHADCLKHEMGSGHPECPQRLAVIAAQMQASGLMDQLECHQAPLATFEQLVRVHTTDYIESVQQASPASGLIYLDPDTAMNPYSLNAALRAAGAVVLATELVMTHKVENAFCAVRPPGHHAESGRAMGFCLFNNITVGVAHALECYDLQRV
ncbi:MAG: histone deacetylase family protein, partial [Nitrosomonas sp.]|nr:histone deacetylase family protein [Nitrosomonas sp.]